MRMPDPRLVPKFSSFTPTDGFSADLCARCASLS